MNEIHQLHDAARRYCTEHHAYWAARYSNLTEAGGDRTAAADGNWDYSDAAYDLFPRHQLLAAILREVERFAPADLATTVEARSFLSAAGETAESPFTEIDHPTAKRAMADELLAFVDFVRSADTSRLAGRVPLPYRRVLGDSEQTRLRHQFAARWGTWYGGDVSPVAEMPPVATLFIDVMDAVGAYDALRAALSGRGFERVLELREWGDAYEIDAVATNFTYTGAEGFWTGLGREADWMVYASHESSITFGGGWLIDAMRAALPAFDRCAYRGWDPAASADPA